MHHIRKGKSREWYDFPRQSKDSQLIIHFNVKDPFLESTISLRQYDINLDWEVTINGKNLGNLAADEKDMISFFDCKAGILKASDNILIIKAKESIPGDLSADDIMVGQVFIDQRPRSKILNECSLDVEIRDAGTELLLPSRLTIVDKKGSLIPVSVPTDDLLAARTGTIYTGNGKASFHLPSGSYKIFASRGFEYGVDSFLVVLKAGDHSHKNFLIRHEVTAKGWISCDPHIHTFTFSGHGDATVKDRILSIAGEGIDLPVITDHNVAVDIRAQLDSLGMGKWFLPVIGDEITTSIGHFNVFPLDPGLSIPDYPVKDWNDLERNIRMFNAIRVIILNHARDIHNGFRPFDPQFHIAVAGQDLRGWAFPANAMEVMNSGSQQPDPCQLLSDWMGMMNRGFRLSPVGSSDSHDLSRYLVGQARTYIQMGNRNIAVIDSIEAINQFAAGHVSVSFGLLTEMKVDSLYGPGDMVVPPGNLHISIGIWGPDWTNVDHLTLYANGQKLREIQISKKSKAGLLWSQSWIMPRPAHDVYLVAVAQGRGRQLPYWSIARPFEHKSTIFNPTFLGITGAIRIDADGDGRFESPYDYAKLLWDSSHHQIGRLIRSLVKYDESVSIQSASILAENGIDLDGNAITNVLAHAPLKVRKGFMRYKINWKISKAFGNAGNFNSY